MKIILILPFLKAGGTERQASYIANYLHNNGHHVQLLCIENTGQFGTLFDVPIHYLNSKFRNSRLFRNIYLVARYLRNSDTDVIISRAWSTNIICGIVGMLTGQPVVHFLSGSIDLSGHSFLKKRIFTFVLSRSAKIISVSHASKENCIKWLNIDEKLIEVVHNGVDVHNIQQLAKEEMEIPDGFNHELPTITFVGTQEHRKGVDILLQAAEQVVNTHPVNVLIIGKGESLEQYVAMRDKMKLKNYVFFLGEKLNPFPYMKKASIFILPSRAEGFPNVLLEAMSLKCAVIAADCETGPREVIDGKNGILIPVEDPQSLSNEMIKLIRDPDKVMTFGEHAFQTIQHHFSLNMQMQKLKEILECV
jgi:glycosyltransferase involved in cell wall biosynthesis